MSTETRTAPPPLGRRGRRRPRRAETLARGAAAPGGARPALVERYREPHRRYHDARHLLAVLRHVDAFAGDQDLFLVRLAAWFHDAIYDVP